MTQAILGSIIAISLAVTAVTLVISFRKLAEIRQMQERTAAYKAESAEIQKRLKPSP